MARWPWRPKASGSATSSSSGASGIPNLFGAAVPGPGVQGDTDGYLELWRRSSEQAALNAGGYYGDGYAGWSPYVSEYSARQVPALTAGLRLISGVCMQLPLRQKRGEAIVDPPATIISNPTPGPNRTVADWVDEYVSDVLLYGNYAAIIGPLDSTGWPSSLVPLDITQVSVARDPDTWLPVYALEGIDDPLPSDRIFHVALDKRSGEVRGRGVLPTLAGAIGAALAADAYAGRYFTESAVPSGVITDTRPNLTQDQANDLKSKWMQAVSGTRAPVVIPPSTTFVPLATDADKAQLVQARQWDAADGRHDPWRPPLPIGDRDATSHLHQRGDRIRPLHLDHDPPSPKAARAATIRPMPPPRQRSGVLDRGPLARRYRDAGPSRRLALRSGDRHARGSPGPGRLPRRRRSGGVRPQAGAGAELEPCRAGGGSRRPPSPSHGGDRMTKPLEHALPMGLALVRHDAGDGEAEDAGDGRTLVGLAVPFGVELEVSDYWGWDSYTEVFEKGSFTKTIRDRSKPVPLLAHHAHRALGIGRATSLVETDAGLEATFHLTEGVQLADEVLALVLDEAISGLSIGFEPVKESRTEGSARTPPSRSDLVVRTEVALREVSVCNFPAYELAGVTGVRDASVARHPSIASLTAERGRLHELRTVAVDRWGRVRR